MFAASTPSSVIPVRPPLSHYPDLTFTCTRFSQVGGDVLWSGPQVNPPPPADINSPSHVSKTNFLKMLWQTWVYAKPGYKKDGTTVVVFPRK